MCVQERGGMCTGTHAGAESVQIQCCKSRASYTASAQMSRLTNTLVSMATVTLTCTPFASRSTPARQAQCI